VSFTLSTMLAHAACWEYDISWPRTPRRKVVPLPPESHVDILTPGTCPASHTLETSLPSFHRLSLEEISFGVH
jgi:hypothetical protein